MAQDSARSSWAESSVRSTRSTQASFASSRTSHCSSASCASSNYAGMPQNRPEDQYTYPDGWHGSTLGDVNDISFISDGAGRSSTPNYTKCVPETAQARCPWCPESFTRSHDFRKHARSFHFSRTFWQCCNRNCRERTYSERQAKMHPNRTGSVDCKNAQWMKKMLHCDRKHFGCAHCARYFDDSAAYLDHLSKQCSPGKAPRSEHQSLRIRALLQQPNLLPQVEACCLRLRGDSQAFRQLWWTWKEDVMTDIIERLEYGIQEHVDSKHPGIAVKVLDSFLHDLLAPSPKSILVTEFIKNYHSAPATTWQQKPLPARPRDELPSSLEVQYHQEDVFQQARSYLQPEMGHHNTPLEPSPYHLEVEGYSVQPTPNDPMIAGSYSDGLPQWSSFDEFQSTFQWNHLQDDLNVDPRQCRWF